MTTQQDFQSQIHSAADYIRQKLEKTPDICVILGSGLSNFADTAFTSKRSEIKYEDIPNFPHTTVAGHRGILYYGYIGKAYAICFAGRFHSYEGHPPQILTLLPRLASELGCKIYILTNAAGGTLKGMKVGCLMAITSHGSTVKFNPMYNCEQPSKQQKLEFTDLSSFEDNISHFNYPMKLDSMQIYDPELVSSAQKIAHDSDFIKNTSFELNGENRTVELHTGTYMFNSGPNFESHAETQYCQQNAPGTVGMSSAPEALMAKALGMRVFGLSLITNLASGLSDEVIKHEDVQKVANCVSKAVEELIKRLIDSINFSTQKECAKLIDLSQNNNICEPLTSRPAKLSESYRLVTKLEGAKKAIIFTQIMDKKQEFDVKIANDIAFIGIARNADIYTTSQLLWALKQNSIAQINYVDRSLPKNIKVHCSNVVNMSGEQFFLHANIEQPKISHKGPTLAIFDGIEDPNTNVYFKSQQKREHFDYMSNQLNENLIIQADMQNFDLQVVSIDQSNTFDTTSVVPKQLHFNYNAPRMNVFTCEPPSYDMSARIAKLLPTGYNKVIMLDFVQDKDRIDQVAQFLNFYECEKLRDSRVNAYSSAKEPKTIIIDVMNLYENRTFADICLAGRILAFNYEKLSRKDMNDEQKKLLENGQKTVQKDNDFEVYVLSNGTTCKSCWEVTDIINQAAINCLRGLNDEKFGPRFQDLSQIVSGRKFKEMPGKVAVLTLCPMNRLAQMKSSAGELVGESCLQELVVLNHQMKGRRYCVCGPVDQLFKLCQDGKI